MEGNHVEEVGLDPHDVLNEDCWRELMEWLDSQTLKSCSETCTLFEDLLAGKECAWLFGKILPFILPYLTGRNRNSPTWTSLLPCRLVCKEWNREILNHLEAELIRRPSVVPKTLAPVSNYFFRPWQQSRMDSFLNIFANHLGSPFVGGLAEFVVLQNPNANDWEVEPDVVKMAGFLEQFGGYLSTLHLSAPRGSSQLTIYGLIRRILLQTPNLKAFNFDWVDDESRHGVEHFDDYVRENQLPTLPCLQTLRLEVSQQYRRKLVEEVAGRYGRQLKVLELTDYGGLASNLCAGLTSLQELSLEEVPWWNVVDDLRVLQAPLQTLQVSICSCLSLPGPSDTYWQVDKFLGNIQHLPITKLIIHLANYFLGEALPISPQLQMPSVTHLKIRQWDLEEASFNFNFLGCFPNLEVLEYRGRGNIAVRRNPPNRIQDTFGGLLVGENLHRSRIWEVFSKLKRIKIRNHDSPRCVRTYCRANYERLAVRMGH